MQYIPLGFLATNRIFSFLDFSFIIKNSKTFLRKLLSSFILKNLRSFNLNGQTASTIKFPEKMSPVQRITWSLLWPWIKQDEKDMESNQNKHKCGEDFEIFQCRTQTCTESVKRHVKIENTKYTYLWVSSIIFWYAPSCSLYSCSLSCWMLKNESSLVSNTSSWALWSKNWLPLELTVKFLLWSSTISFPQGGCICDTFPFWIYRTIVVR